DDVLLLQPELEVETQATHRGRAGAADDQFHFFDFLSGDLQGVLQRRGGDDGGAMLVVVENGDLHLALEALFDFEALRRGDVLEVDAAERRLQHLHRLNEFVRVAGGDLEVEHIDVGKACQQECFPVYHPLAGGCPDVAVNADCCTTAYA